MTPNRASEGGHRPVRLTLLQPAFLGDVVLSTALLESWRRTFPQDRLEVLVRKGAEGLFADHPFVQGVHVWDRSGWLKYPRLAGLSRSLRGRDTHLVVNLHRHPSMALLTRAVRPEEAVGFSGATAPHGRRVRLEPHGLGDGRHETERNHALVAPWLGAWDAALDVPRLHPSGRHWKAAGLWPEDALVLAPASVWATKRWPPEQWAALADAWTERQGGGPVVLLGGAGDRPLLEEVARACRLARPQVCAGDLDLLGASALMARSRAVVSNDSAPLHMAGAVGAPVVGVFCSTTPRFGFGVLPGMLAGGRAAQVEVGEAELECKPCGPHGHARCPEGHFKCGSMLDVARVLEAVVRVSSPPSGSPTP